MVTTCRQVIVGQTVILEIDLRDATGQIADADSSPEVEIISSQGNVTRAMSSSYVSRIDTGRYRTTYTVSANGPTGIWVDHWKATLNGFTTEARLNFIVLAQDADIGIAGDQIGDPARVTYTDAEIRGINILLGCLKARLKNNLEVEALDAYGNRTFTSCSVFTNDELVWFLKCSLSEFNQTPHFTDFTFDMEVIYKRFGHIIVEGAFILATAAQMLIEAGREFTITDNGISMNPPPLSSALNNELSTFVQRHTDMLKYIKTSIKPYPIGFGGFRVLAVSPNYMRLRHLRQRRII
jgi:hypothetical protein